MDNIINDRERRRYALETQLGTAIADYVEDGDVVTITHTEVPAALEGRGIASKLIAFALTDIRDRGMKVVPACSFVRVYIDRHEKWRSLLA